MAKSSVPGAYKTGDVSTVITPKTIETDRSKASGKAKMNFKNPPLEPYQDIKGNGPIKHRAMTPGTTPDGS